MQLSITENGKRKSVPETPNALDTHKRSKTKTNKSVVVHEGENEGDGEDEQDGEGDEKTSSLKALLSMAGATSRRLSAVQRLLFWCQLKEHLSVNFREFDGHLLCDGCETDRKRDVTGVHLWLRWGQCGVCRLHVFRTETPRQ